MTKEKDKVYELLTAMHELFEYGFPIYKNSLLLDDGLETFGERVEELLKEKQ